MAKAAPKTDNLKPTADVQYVVKSNLSHDNVDYGDGDPIELDDAQAAPLLDLGVIAAKGE